MGEGITLLGPQTNEGTLQPNLAFEGGPPPPVTPVPAGRHIYMLHTATFNVAASNAGTVARDSGLRIYFDDRLAFVVMLTSSMRWRLRTSYDLERRSLLSTEAKLSGEFVNMFSAQSELESHYDNTSGVLYTDEKQCIELCCSSAKWVGWAVAGQITAGRSHGLGLGQWVSSREPQTTRRR